VEKAVRMEEDEQQRRVLEMEKTQVQEEAIRKINQAMADSAMEKERVSRMRDPSPVVDSSVRVLKKTVQHQAAQAGKRRSMFRE